jgi:hypothetical protein
MVTTSPAASFCLILFMSAPDCENNIVIKHGVADFVASAQ